MGKVQVRQPVAPASDGRGAHNGVAHARHRISSVLATQRAFICCSKPKVTLSSVSVGHERSYDVQHQMIHVISPSLPRTDQVPTLMNDSRYSDRPRAEGSPGSLICQVNAILPRNRNI